MYLDSFVSLVLGSNVLLRHYEICHDQGTYPALCLLSATLTSTEGSKNIQNILQAPLHFTCLAIILHQNSSEAPDRT
jgi:hypothetical protein